MSFFNRTGIVNVKMVITEEKILSNIDKIQKLINPNSKKQIVQLEDDAYFKDLVESVKNYLLEYPKKNNFPKSVYKASYELVEYATNQFEENTKKVEDLIRQRERNIKLANVLRDATNAIKNKVKNWKEILKKLETKYPEDVVNALNIISKAKDTESEEYVEANKLIEAKINNLEGNLHIEIDMERIEDRSKALSFIGIEIAEALKYIPAPVDDIDIGNSNPTEEYDDLDGDTKSNIQDDIDGDSDVEDEEAETEEEQEDESIDDVTEGNEAEEQAQVPVSVGAEEFRNEDVSADDAFIEETRFESKPSLWQKIKNSKFVKTLRYIMQIRITIDYPALPEGRGDE
ncbi:MAG: hypothetical protein K6D97_04610 [Clostridia bacterium]|nr:hypothetical protein [Clostridia bacterium]